MDSYLYNLKDYEYGIRMAELSVKCLLYIDDQLALAPSAHGLQEMVSRQWRQDLSSGIFYELGHVFQKSTIVHSIRVGISEVKLCFQKTPSVQRYYFDDLIGEAPLLQLSADQENKMGR
ncbi:hypothetical protein EVAR_92778_1 [Eumeta japonica]|uniref:Uncharacterized protein n=1 Tax=Eumeta variegata TaxID=151549 RepID=A0A4C1SXA2_EUMVA|nr:hypothetical protein EVAR_92778_1 [Eumeta japonica]